MSDRYILDENGEPVICDDLIQWALWYENPENRTVALTEAGDYFVSTIFLALDYAFIMGDPLKQRPVLWETMVFDKDKEPVGIRARYTSREDAIAGHAEVVAACQMEGA